MDFVWTTVAPEFGIVNDANWSPNDPVSNVIVSLADSNYFGLLNELVDSIRTFEKSKDIAICILDAGLTEEQKKILSKKVDEIKSAEWDIEVSKYKTKGKNNCM